jgi:hypothetical protein
LVARSAVIISGFKQPEGFWFDPRLRSSISVEIELLPLFSQSSVAQLVARSAVMTARSKQPEGFWFDPRLRRDLLLLLGDRLSVVRRVCCFFLVSGLGLYF